jgi:hypothetical protein
MSGRFCFSNGARAIMSDIWVFGYGSLVNAQTHDYQDITPAYLHGWRRDWCHWVNGPSRNATALTIQPAEGHTIAGMIARVPEDAWPALEAREAGYRRFALDNADVDHDGPEGITIHTFQSLSNRRGSAEFPIPQTYVDVVLKGFLDVLGPDALAPFFETTDGWETPILRDRANPRYPRAVELTPDQMALFDSLLDSHGATLID